MYSISPSPKENISLSAPAKILSNRNSKVDSSTCDEANDRSLSCFCLPFSKILLDQAEESNLLRGVQNLSTRKFVQSHSYPQQQIDLHKIYDYESPYIQGMTPNEINNPTDLSAPCVNAKGGEIDLIMAFKVNQLRDIFFCLFDSSIKILQLDDVGIIIGSESVRNLIKDIRNALLSLSKSNDGRVSSKAQTILLTTPIIQQNEGGRYKEEEVQDIKNFANVCLDLSFILMKALKYLKKNQISAPGIIDLSYKKVYYA